MLTWDNKFNDQINLKLIYHEVNKETSGKKKPTQAQKHDLILNDPFLPIGGEHLHKIGLVVGSGRWLTGGDFFSATSETDLMVCRRAWMDS